MRFIDEVSNHRKDNNNDLLSSPDISLSDSAQSACLSKVVTNIGHLKHVRQERHGRLSVARLCCRIGAFFRCARYMAGRIRTGGVRG